MRKLGSTFHCLGLFANRVVMACCIYIGHIPHIQECIMHSEVRVELQPLHMLFIKKNHKFLDLMDAEITQKKLW